ncbi:MAG: hypothetical protein JW395_2955 [Nitrospira sp.]|nr:hypothetical protein [Nitrospira sp.]
MKNLTASDRLALIKLASTMPKGSAARRAILAGLKTSSLTTQKEAFWGKKKNPFADAIHVLQFLVRSPGSMRAHDLGNPERSGDSGRTTVALAALIVALSSQDPVLVKRALSQVPPSHAWNVPPEVFQFVNMNDRRISRSAKSEFKEQFDKADKLDSVVPQLADLIVESGLSDGSPSDDKTSVSKATWSATDLKPSQTSIVLDKVVGMAVFMLIQNKIGGDLGAIVSNDNFIMDGHHRWAATILASGHSGKVGGYKADLKGPELLRVLNILTKGTFGIGGGKPGKGAISDLTPANVSKFMRKSIEKGIGGEHPIPAEKIKTALESHFGSVDEGIETMSENAKSIKTKTPSWAPDRSQMPVIEPTQVPQGAKLMSDGVIDWSAPYKQAGLRSNLIRLAHSNPDLRPHILPLFAHTASADLTGLVVSFEKRNKSDLVGSSRGPGLKHQIRVGFEFEKNGVLYELTDLDRTVVEPVDWDEDDSYAPHVLHVYGRAKRVAA